MSSSGKRRSVDLIRTDVSEELIASIFRVEIIRELRTTSTINTRLDQTAKKHHRRGHSFVLLKKFFPFQSPPSPQNEFDCLRVRQPAR
jgi:hypothetical protein